MCSSAKPGLDLDLDPWPLPTWQEEVREIGREKASGLNQPPLFHYSHSGHLPTLCITPALTDGTYLLGSWPGAWSQGCGLSLTILQSLKKDKTKPLYSFCILLLLPVNMLKFLLPHQHFQPPICSDPESSALDPSVESQWVPLCLA